MSGQIIGLDHIGVAVKDPKERMKIWADLLGLPLEKVETVESEGVRTWFLDMGGSWLELLEPLNDESAVAKSIEKRGEGMHHICFEVDNLEKMLAKLAARGINPLGGGARKGAGGAMVAFLHPKDSGGVLVELSEHGPEECCHDHSVDLEDDEDFDEDPFRPGTVAVLYLANPKERIFGVVRQLDLAGIGIEGIDLESWNDWVQQWARGAEGPIVPSVQFFPMGRVEKLLADVDTEEVPSFTRQFEERTGRSLAEAFGIDIEEEDE